MLSLRQTSLNKKPIYIIYPFHFFIFIRIRIKFPERNRKSIFIYFYCFYFQLKIFTIKFILQTGYPNLIFLKILQESKSIQYTHPPSVWCLDAKIAINARGQFDTNANQP